MEITSNDRFTGVEITKYGTKMWFKNGSLHRIDGPAAIHADGSTEWWQLGVLHREDGPAKDLADGEQQWWVNGTRHRLGGPAITRTMLPGSRSWWIHGKHIRSVQQYQLETKCADEDLALLILRYGGIE